MDILILLSIFYQSKFFSNPILSNAIPRFSLRIRLFSSVKWFGQSPICPLLKKLPLLKNTSSTIFLISSLWSFAPRYLTTASTISTCFPSLPPGFSALILVAYRHGVDGMLNTFRTHHTHWIGDTQKNDIKFRRSHSCHKTYAMQSRRSILFKQGLPQVFPIFTVSTVFPLAGE